MAGKKIGIIIDTDGEKEFSRALSNARKESSLNEHFKMVHCSTKHMPKRKERIDRFGITEYNVGEISEHAKKSYMRERYDEMETEYMTQHRKG